MKKIKHFTILLLAFIVLNSCSKDDSPSCPKIEKISMKINGEYKQFFYSGRGIDLNSNGQGYTLFISFYSGTSSSPENSYQITIKLPYKKTGKNTIAEFDYFRVENLNYYQGDVAEQQLVSKVTVNKNTCFSATFSGSAILDGNEVNITEGVVDVIYDDPF